MQSSTVLCISVFSLLCVGTTSLSCVLLLKRIDSPMLGHWEGQVNVFLDVQSIPLNVTQSD